MLASWPDDGPDARKYELSYGRRRTKRLGECRQKACTTQLSLHRGAAPMKLTADSHTHRIVTERDGDQRRWQPSSASIISTFSRLSGLAGRLPVREILDGLLRETPSWC